jgi:hypothetical protein
MDTNIVELKPKHALAERIRTAYDRMERAANDFVDATMELAVALKMGRDEFPSDIAFGHWLIDEGLEMDRNQRTALIHMAEHADLARQVLSSTRSRYHRQIWEGEIVPLISCSREISTAPTDQQVPRPCEETLDKKADSVESPKTKESKADQKEPKVSERERKMSPLAALHPAAYEALNDARQLRTTFNKYCQFAKTVHKKSWMQYLDGLAIAIRDKGLRVPPQGNSIRVAWGFADGLPKGYPDRGFCEITAFGKDDDDCRTFFRTLKKAQDWTPPVPPLVVLPEMHAKHFTIGAQVVKINGRQIFPESSCRWSLDDACIAVEIANAFYAGAVLSPLSVSELGHILYRDFQSLTLASGVGGLAAAFRQVALVLQGLTDEERSRPLMIAKPSPPTKAARQGKAGDLA